jgi:hypothetical protein
VWTNVPPPPAPGPPCTCTRHAPIRALTVAHTISGRGESVARMTTPTPGRLLKVLKLRGHDQLDAACTRNLPLKRATRRSRLISIRHSVRGPVMPQLPPPGVALACNDNRSGARGGPSRCLLHTLLRPGGRGRGAASVPSRPDRPKVNCGI